MTFASYRPSGRVPVAAVPYSLLFAAATLPGSLLYAFASADAPTLLRPLFMLIFGVCLGVCTTYAAKKGKVRNPVWMGRIGLMIAFIGWLFHWIEYSAIVLSEAHLLGDIAFDNFVTVVAHPHHVIAALARLFAGGGFGHAIAWLVEFVVLLAISHLCGRTQASEPFCEASNSWAEKVEHPGKFAFVKDPTAVAQCLTSAPDKLALVLRPWIEGGSASYSKVTVYRCPAGSNLFLSIENTEAIGAKPKTKERKSNVLDLLHLTGANADEVISQLTKLTTKTMEQPNSEGSAAPAELRLGVQQLEAGHFQAALEAARPFLNAHQQSLRVDAVRLSALATAGLGRWAESLGFWDALFQEEQTTHNALQVATTSVMSGDVPRGEAWIAKAFEINSETREIELPLLLTSFVTALSQSGQMHAAMPYLDQIKDIYTTLGTTDSIFLRMCHVPLFSAFLEKSEPIIRVALGWEKGRSWYKSMLPYLDENGREKLTSWLETKFAEERAQPLMP